MKRSRFIWLADQRVDHAAGFTTLRGTPLRREEEGVNRWVLARGSFDARADIGSATLSIAVDGRYRLWLNAVPIGRGPVRSSPAFQRFDRYDVRDRLRPGHNQLAVLIHVPGIDLAWYETAKGGWQPVFGDGALAVELMLAAGDESWLVGSDDSWRMAESEAWRRDAPRSGWGQDFIECFDARRFDPRWIEAGFDDSVWPHARAMVAEPEPEVRARGWGRVTPFPLLVESAIPAPVEREALPNRLLWMRPALPAPDLDIDKRLYAATFDDEDASLIDNSAALLTDDDAVATVRTNGDRDTALMLAFDPYHAGRPFIELDARGGEVVEIAVAEALPGEFGRGLAGDGLRDEGHLGCAQIFRYIARPGVQRFERFNWTAVRAMQLVVRNAPHGLRIRRIGSVVTHYPAVEDGAFACSDPLLERLWHVARDTVRNCMHDAWVDCPGREARQWVGDPVVMFDVAALCFGPSVFPLHRQFLRHAAESQRQDGLVRMFAPGDIGPDALTIPDFTLLWIIGAERYWRASGDLGTIEALMPAVERGLAWFERSRSANGLLADIPHWHFIEWADLDRRGESAAINALYSGALGAAAVLARAAGRERLAADWDKLRDEVVTALNRRHWCEARGLYVDSVDPESGHQRTRVSQHANALAILFGIAPKERWPKMLATMTDRDRLKLTSAPPIVAVVEPFDETRDIVRANSFFSHFVFAGIARAGGFEWVVEELRRSFGPMLEIGATTLWESFSPNASLCHGFSSTPLFQLSAHALGVTAIEPGFVRFSVSPDPGGLESAAGRVPTPHGSIAIAWRRERGRVHVDVRHPATCQLATAETLRLISEDRYPGGAALVFALA